MIVTVEELNPDDVTPIESDKKIAPPTGDAIQLNETPPNGSNIGTGVILAGAQNYKTELTPAIYEI